MPTNQLPQFHDILEMFGVRTTGGIEILFKEGKGPADGRVLIAVSSSGISGDGLTASQARYLAAKLNVVADKLDQKAKAAKPCSECGKP